jgi:predicted alpha/beta-fold hydrolase
MEFEKASKYILGRIEKELPSFKLEGPIISSGFLGNKFWRNAHAETIIPSIFRKINISYQRERFTLADSDFIDLDWVKENKPNLIILFHGLEGSSQSQYIKGFVNTFSKQNFDCCAVNFRSCSGQNNKLLRSYHSGASEDMHEVISHVLATNHYQRIYLVGFSLGGNVLLKYLGENKFQISPLVQAAIAFSVPIDLSAGATKLAQLSNGLYMRIFLNSLNTKLKEKAKVFPGKLDIADLDKIKTFQEWDNRFTAPINGFEDAADYYQKSSSKQYLKNIVIPTLLVNALNDPFLPSACFPVEAEISQSVIFESPSYGGHCGFAIDWPNGNYYSEQRALQFFLNKT